MVKMPMGDIPPFMSIFVAAKVEPHTAVMLTASM